MMKRRRRASHLGRFALWHNGRRATQLCRFNSVDLLCGTTAAKTFERWTFWKIQQTQIDSRTSANSWNMYALRRFSKLLKMNALRRQDKRPQQTLEDAQTPRELVRLSGAKRKQVPQSETNVCRRRRQMQSRKTSLINCTGHPIIHTNTSNAKIFPTESSPSSDE